MQGVFVYGSRPKSKAEIRRLMATEDFDPYAIVIEATSLFGNEFDGSLAEADRQELTGPFTIVGPDPYTKRNFYGNIKKTSKGWTIT